MKEAINGLWDIHGFEFSGLAKFIRCLFQALSPVNTQLCEELLEIAVEMAKEPTDVSCFHPEAMGHGLVLTLVGRCLFPKGRSRVARCQGMEPGL